MATQTVAATVPVFPQALSPDPRKAIQVAVRNLIVDSEVQRGCEPERIQRIAHEFEWRRLEAITVVSIGRNMYRVVEGQHRTLAVKLRDPDALVWALVLPAADTSTGREAGLALEISTGRRPHTAYQQWNARLTRGDRHEILATDTLRTHGLRIGKSPSARSIAASGEVTRMIHSRRQTPELGAELLNKTLTVIMAAWPDHDPKSSVSRFDGRLLSAISEIISRNAHIDLNRLSLKLATKMASRWISDELLAGPRVVRDAIATGVIKVYNSRLPQRNAITW
jgi:hypothetical protein